MNFEPIELSVIERSHDTIYRWNSVHDRTGLIIAISDLRFALPQEILEEEANPGTIPHIQRILKFRPDDWAIDSQRLPHELDQNQYLVFLRYYQEIPGKSSLILQNQSGWSYRERICKYDLELVYEFKSPQSLQIKIEENTVKLKEIPPSILYVRSDGSEDDAFKIELPAIAIPWTHRLSGISIDIGKDEIQYRLSQLQPATLSWGIDKSSIKVVGKPYKLIIKTIASQLPADTSVLGNEVASGKLRIADLLEQASWQNLPWNVHNLIDDFFQMPSSRIRTAILEVLNKYLQSPDDEGLILKRIGQGLQDKKTSKDSLKLLGHLDLKPSSQVHTFLETYLRQAYLSKAELVELMKVFLRLYPDEAQQALENWLSDISLMPAALNLILSEVALIPEPLDIIATTSVRIQDFERAQKSLKFLIQNENDFISRDEDAWVTFFLENHKAYLSHLHEVSQNYVLQKIRVSPFGNFTYRILQTTLSDTASYHDFGYLYFLAWYGVNSSSAYQLAENNDNEKQRFGQIFYTKGANCVQRHLAHKPMLREIQETIELVKLAGQTGNPSLFRAIAGYLAEEYPIELRLAAINSIGQFRTSPVRAADNKDIGAMYRLSMLLKEEMENPEVKMSALNALGQMAASDEEILEIQGDLSSFVQREGLNEAVITVMQRHQMLDLVKLILPIALIKTPQLALKLWKSLPHPDLLDNVIRTLSDNPGLPFNPYLPSLPEYSDLGAWFFAAQEEQRLLQADIKLLDEWTNFMRQAKNAGVTENLPKTPENSLNEILNSCLARIHDDIEQTRLEKHQEQQRIRDSKATLLSQKHAWTQLRHIYQNLLIQLRNLLKRMESANKTRADNQAASQEFNKSIEDALRKIGEVANESGSVQQARDMLNSLFSSSSGASNRDQEGQIKKAIETISKEIEVCEKNIKSLDALVKACEEQLRDLDKNQKVPVLQAQAEKLNKIKAELIHFGERYNLNHQNIARVREEQNRYRVQLSAKLPVIRQAVYEEAAKLRKKQCEEVLDLRRRLDQESASRTSKNGEQPPVRPV